MDSKESELKEIYRSIYAYAKHLDEQKKSLNNIGDLFNHDLEDKRIALVQRCITLIFKDFAAIGKKSREILWRKGYYDHIAFAKKQISAAKEKITNQSSPTIMIDSPTKTAIPPEHLEKLKKLLLEGIGNYKKIASKMEEHYDLDLKLWIDYTIIDDQDHGKFQPNGQPAEKSINTVNCALDTIHSAFLSLGDLHRYYLDFKIDQYVTTKQQLKITKNLTAKFYYEAFKINPIIGMTQNQLGTLFYGRNYDLDSIYHYLYSLICTVPFDLSETNVCKLFLQHSNYLENLDPNKVEFSLKDFYARFFLIVDIYFFDKDVPEFTSLCHCVLIDLKKILCSTSFQISSDSVLKIVCILFFCMSKLKMINSQKIYALNAFLVAVCSDLIDSCIVNIEQMILTNSNEIEIFKEYYDEKFIKYESVVKDSREKYKQWYEERGKGERTKRETNRNSAKQFQSVGGSSGSPENDMMKSKENIPPLQQQKESSSANSTAAVVSGVKSSDETKDSDLKTPLSNKSKKKAVKLRRRRKKIAESDASSCYDVSDDSEDLNSDFISSDDEDFDSDLSSNFESDFSDIEDVAPENETLKYEKSGKAENLLEIDENGQKEEASGLQDNLGLPKLNDFEKKLSKAAIPELKKNIKKGVDFANSPTQSKNNFELFDDTPSENEDCDETGKLNEIAETLSQEMVENFNMLVLNENELTFKNDEHENVANGHVEKTACNLDTEQAPTKLKYKNKYMKINPNLIIDFAKKEPTITALKILFDWLRINHEILLGCYHSNPEFIHKIMKLLNFLNIDIFTQKVFFELEFINNPEIRNNLSELFETRNSIPLNEDLNLKNFDLFRSIQIPYDWEAKIRDKITEDEESVLRILKMVDFGFYICKSKKFNYQFCAKTRKFTENLKKKRENNKKGAGKRRERRSGNATGRTSGRLRREGRRNEGRTRRYSDRKGGHITKKEYTSNEEKDTGLEDHQQFKVDKSLKKGYLRSKNQEKFSSSGADEEKSETQKDEIERKCEIMGKLWLKNEVEVLEEKIRKLPKDIVLTPFVVIDSKALVDYTAVVKELVKCKKFIVLIPNAVLGELDDLKKRSEAARNVIRWLEKEFKYGNRYLRSQRDNENLPLQLIKVPRKLNREASIFLKIAQFCNYMVTNHFEGNIEFQANAITFLSGDNLHEKKCNNFSFTGILDCIPARYDQIASFYAKLKNK